MKRLLAFLMAVALLLPSLRLDARGIDPVADSLSREKLRHYLDSVRVTKNRPTVALVLSGGGAKGAAHIGMVRRIEELGIPVDLVVGTSMGGLISGLFAMGYDSYDMEDVITNADWGRLITDKMPIEYRSLQEKQFKAQHQLILPLYFEKKQFVLMKQNAYDDEGDSYVPLSLKAKKEDEAQLLKDNILESLPFGAVKGMNVYNLISSLTAGYQGDIDFMDLPIPYVSVATDLISFKGKYWFDGPLPLALRSTMSIPFLYAPVKYDGMVLVDGGMRDNYPTTFVRSLGADYIIGMELSDPKKTYQEVNNVGDVAGQMIDLLIADNYERNKDGADVKVKPDLHEYNMLSFSDENITEIIKRGYATAQAADSLLLEVKAAVNGDTLSFKGHKAANLQKNKYLFDQIVISGVTDSEAAMLRKKINLKEGKRYNDADIQEAVNVIFGTRAFDKVTYEVYGECEPFVLDLKCDRGPIHQIAMGARFDNEEVVSLLVDAGLAVRKLKGPKANLTLRLAENPSARLRLYMDMAKFPTVNFSAFAQYTNVGRIIAQADIDELSIPGVGGALNGSVSNKAPQSSWYANADIYFSGIRWKVTDFRLGARLDYYNMMNSDLRMYRGEFDMRSKSNAYANVYAEMKAEKYDRVYFPERGYSFGAYYAFNMYDLVAKRYNPFHVVYFGGKVFIPMGSHFTLIPSYDARMVFGEEVPYTYANFIGGSITGRYMQQQLQFIGINNYAAMGNILTQVRLDLRLKVKESHYFTLTGNYARDCADFSGYLKGPGFYGVGLEYGYDSIVGPITLNVHYSNISRKPGAYLSIGVIF